jgi:hypothetical protein
MKDSEGNWIPDMFAKQAQVFNNRSRALLVPGPRLSGKTRAVLHRIARHLWEVDGARVGMFAKIMKNSKDSGAWDLMTKQIIAKEWIRANIGMRFTTSVGKIPGPKIDGTTRTAFFKVTNSHGGESEMQLFSLDNDEAAEDKLKEMEFSMIYFPELDKFGTKKVLTVGLPTLRMAGIPFEDQMWIADCNPSEEGPDSWIYQTFYVERNMTYEQFSDYQKSLDIPPMKEEDFKSFYGSLNVIEILPKDNIFVDPRQLQEVKVACGTDLGLYARHIEGKWVWGGGDSSRHFRSILNKRKYVYGNADPKTDEESWVTLLPTDGCTELVSGWDLGDTNHAAALMEKTLELRYDRDPKTQLLVAKFLAHFWVMDELVVLGEETSVNDFTLQIMEKVFGLEAYLGRKIGLGEHAWSDRSSIERYNAAADTFQHLEVEAASDGRFNLRGAPKAWGSVMARITLLKNLLKTGRFHVSAHCFQTLKMLRDLKKGKTQPIQPDDPCRHIFDAITYALMMECREEMLMSSGISPAVRRQLETQSLEVHV